MPKHLAIVCEGLVPHDVAGEQAVSIAKALAGRGHRVTLLCAVAVDAQADDRVTLIVRGRRLPRSARGAVGFRRWLLAQRDRLRPDHVISLTTLFAGDVHVAAQGTVNGHRRSMARLCAPLPVRVGSFLRSLWPGIVLRSTMEKRTLADPGLKACFAASQVVADEWATLSNDRQLAIETFALMLEPPSVTGASVGVLRQQLARGLGMDEQSKWIVFPFNEGWVAGIEPLLIAFRTLIDDGLDAVLLLAGPSRYTHLAWIAQLGLRERVRFLGRPDVPDRLYAVADLVVQPTAYDPVGVPSLQALACGVPVITSTASGAAEMVADQGGGVLRAPVDAFLLAEAVAQALETGRAGAKTNGPETHPGPGTGPIDGSDLAQRIEAVLAGGVENPAAGD